MSETVLTNAPTGPAARLGAELRNARLSLGWELGDLARSLRIRQAYLEAIEAGRMSDLPGSTYALGFVRTYASALGLPGEQVASRLRAETGEANIRPQLSFPAPVPQRGVPAGALMLLGMVVLAGAYSGWYYFSEHQRTPSQTVPPIPDRLQSAQVKPPPSPQVATLLPNAAPPAPVPPVPVGTNAPASPVAAPGAPAATQSAPPPAGPEGAPGAGTSPMATPGSAAKGSGTTTVIGPGAPGASQAAMPPAASAAQPRQAGLPGSGAPAGAAGSAAQGLGQPPQGAGSAAQAVPPGTRIVVKASADAWVSVKPKGGGAPVLNKLLHAGDSWPVPADKANLVLTTGNAGGTQIEVDGAPVASLGASGMVRRDLPLDPDVLKSGNFPPIGKPHKAAPAPASGE